jgi:signal transduction histidine kinase
VRAQLFTRAAFSTSRQSASGGLGLMIVKRILQLHDSDIELLQRPGTGAIFRFQLNTPPSA